MEQECIRELCHSLGISARREFSSEDVCLLFHKVFHMPSTVDDVHVAIKKISGTDDDWSIVSEKVLDVLLQMEMEREQREELYWDLQLINAGKLNALYKENHLDNTYHQAPGSRNTCTEANTFKPLQNRSDLWSVPSHFILTDTSQRQGEEWSGALKDRSGRCSGRLQRAARQDMARLIGEGVYSVLPSVWLAPSPRFRGQAWGCVSVSDLVLLVDGKYDAISHMLYTEMLQEHHGLVVWGNLLAWQQKKWAEDLADLAEEALESGDLINLSDLPGAFKIYRCRGGVSTMGHSDWLVPREESWSAISLLTEIQTCHQQERDTLTALCQRLSRESLGLLCLYLRLASLRAHREVLSYGALLAARQSWETWPSVSSLYRTELASLWLQGGEEEEEKDFCISASPQQMGSLSGGVTSSFSQQAVLQWLVLCQEQERKYLIKLFKGISLDDLQGANAEGAPREEQKQSNADFREGCVRQLRQIHSSLQNHTDTKIHPSEQKSLNPVHDPQSVSQSQPQTLGTQKSPLPLIPDQSKTCASPAWLSQPRWAACVLILLKQLMEVQETQVSTVLPTLLDVSVHHLLTMRDAYESEYRQHGLTSLLQLLTSRVSPASESSLTFDPPEPTTTQFSSMSESIGEEPHPVGTEGEDTERGDHCAGCGKSLEDLPYLEILCTSDTTHGSPTEDQAVDGGVEPRRSPQTYEKQGSLITLAWSRPPGEDPDCEVEAEAGRGAEEPHSECSVKPVGRPGEEEEKTGDTHSEAITVGSSMVEDSTALVSREDPTTMPAEQQHSTEGQTESASEEKTLVTELPEQTRQTPFDSHLQTQEVAVEIPEAEPSHPSPLPPEVEEQIDDLCPEPACDGGYQGSVGGEQVEVDMCPTEDQMESVLWDTNELESMDPEDPQYIPQATEDWRGPDRDITGDSVVVERERAREPLSVMERERTMRNLVDIQRKVEQKQQRDRQRQLLRVRERLSIIQHKKAEEDLLGLNQTDTLRHVTDNLPQEDKSQRTVVRERLEQLRRERSYVMQSKRDRNTAVFRELLGPVALGRTETEDGGD